MEALTIKDLSSILEQAKERGIENIEVLLWIENKPARMALSHSAVIVNMNPSRRADMTIIGSRRKLRLYLQSNPINPAEKVENIVENMVQKRLKEANE